MLSSSLQMVSEESTNTVDSVLVDAENLRLMRESDGRYNQSSMRPALIKLEEITNSAQCEYM
jgi:hypothetical protein